MIWLIGWFLVQWILQVHARKDHLSFQLNDLAKQLTGKEIVCHKEGQIVSLPEATNGTFQSPCFQCICRNRNLICSRKLCPPIPPNCPVTIQSPRDECCLECAYCIDEWNQKRENGDLWPSRNRGKCSRYVCESGIKTLSQMYCVNSCAANIGIESRSYCCRLCPIQAAQDPFMRINDDPCVRCETVGGFWQQCYRLACPVLNCPPDQQKHTHRQQCCPRCIKKRELIQTNLYSGVTCQFRHTTYVPGQKFRPDACSQCECTAIGLECQRYVCPIECPDGYYRPQVCCPFCGHLRNKTKYLLPDQLNVQQQCVIQINSTQMIWKNNDHWSPDACTTCSCSNGQVSCQTRVCPKVDCNLETQRKVVPVGQCCAKCVELKKHQKDGHGICKLSPDARHLRTFDGSSVEIRRPCTYILVQHCLFNGELPVFVLKSHQNSAGQLQKLSLELNEKNIHLGVLNIVRGKQLKYRGRNIKLPQSTRVFNATYEKQRLTIDLHATGLKIVWLKAKGIRLYADRKHSGNLCGLCSNFNGVSNDDLLPRFAMNITLDNNLFVRSWQSENEEGECRSGSRAKMEKIDETNLPKEDKQKLTKMPSSNCQRLIHSKIHKEERRRFGQNCSKLKKSPFLGACLSQFRVNSFLKQCMADVCECEQKGQVEKNKEPCYCSSMNAYVQECAQRGLLTLGTYSHSPTNSIRIHAKCSAIDIERV